MYITRSHQCGWTCRDQWKNSPVVSTFEDWPATVLPVNRRLNKLPAVWTQWITFGLQPLWAHFRKYSLEFAFKFQKYLLVSSWKQISSCYGDYLHWWYKGDNYQWTIHYSFRYIVLTHALRTMQMSSTTAACCQSGRYLVHKVGDYCVCSCILTHQFPC